MDFFIAGKHSSEKEWAEECDKFAAELAASKESVLKSLNEQAPSHSEIEEDDTLRLLAKEVEGQEVYFGQRNGIQFFDGERIVIEHPQLIASMVTLGIGFEFGCSRNGNVRCEFFPYTCDDYNELTERTTICPDDVDYDFCNVILSNLGQIVYERGLEVDPMRLEIFKGILNRLSYVRQYSNGMFASVDIEKECLVKLTVTVPCMAVDQCSPSIAPVFYDAEKVTITCDSGYAKMEFILPRVWKI